MAPVAAMVAACSPQPAGTAIPPESNTEITDMDEATEAAQPVRDLPYARGRTFATLDEYLAHLRANGAIDLPWYREIRPGVYELQTSRMPRGEPEIYTREELMRRFGFTR